MSNEKKYDVVIIGSGIGGLLCGLILAKSRYSVCILEKHHQIGGNIQTFKRKGCTFTTGMHYVGSLEEGEILNKVFKYLGIIDKIKVRKLDEKCFEKIYIEDEEFNYAMGMDNFKAQLLEYFPEEKDAIEKYIKKIESIWKNIKLINLEEVTEADIFKLDSLTENAYDFIESLTDNKKLKALLVATNGLYAGVKEKTPMHIHAIINKFFINSAWKLDESEVLLADVIKNEIESYGGEVLTNKEVKKINCENGLAINAVTTNNEVFEARNFISDIHPAKTTELLEAGLLRKIYVNRIKNAENTISCFSLYIVLKKNSLKHINSNIYYSDSWNVWGTDTYDSKNWPKGYIFYTSPDKDNGEYAESATTITYMKYEEVEKWENTTIGKRGDDYLDYKKMKAEAFLKVIEKKIPDFRSHIDTYYTASPLTYRDYTGIPEGSMYGIIKDCNNPLDSFISHNTKVTNLFLTGQNINLHGILGVTMSAMISCSNLIDINKLIKEIKNV
ncbi:MAG: NAD(P)/FAD-dependent oxidoreductase [Bacteroidetes bacterium]|nr:NAD(P)/FAD-dependent oxidoreductase [Bacteroidota bacterium]